MRLAERRYRRKVGWLVADWAQAEAWFFDEAVRRADREPRLRRLEPAGRFAEAHAGLLSALEARRERLAAGDPEGAIEAQFDLFDATERLRSALPGAATPEERAYGDAAGRILDTAESEFDGAVERAREESERAIARLRGVRAPGGLEPEHAATVAAFGAYAEALGRMRVATRARDRAAALEAWRAARAGHAELRRTLNGAGDRAPGRAPGR